MPTAVEARRRWGAVHGVHTLRGKLKQIRGMHMAGLLDPSMRALAAKIARTCPERDDACEVRAVYQWVRRNIRYTDDVEGFDTHASPMRTVEWGIGDCDDSLALVTCLMRHLGYRVGVRVAETGTQGYDHVYAIAGWPKLTPVSYVAMDTTEARWPGWEAASRRHRDFLW